MKIYNNFNTVFHSATILITSITLTLISNNAFTQTLDNAINDQLEFFGGIECGRLLDLNPLNALLLTGELANICSRGAPAAGIGSSNSNGGSAAAPTSLQSIAKKRLRQAHDKNETFTREKAVVEEGASKPGFFITVESEILNRQITTFEDGYESDITRLTAGIDKQINANWLSGFAIDAFQQKGSFIGGGDFDTTSTGIVFFASYNIANNAYIDFYAGYNEKSYLRNRPALFTQLDSNGDVDYTSNFGYPRVDYDSSQRNAGILIAYDYNIENFTFGPSLGLDWVDTDYGTYSETGTTGLELTYHNDKQTSLQSSLGIWFSTAISTNFGVVTIQQSFDWKHEFDKDQRNVEVSFTGDTRGKRFIYKTESPDRNYFEISLGLSVVLPHELQMFANARTILGHDFIDNYALSLGLRKQF